MKKIYIHLSKIADKNRRIYDHKKIGLVEFGLKKKNS